MPPAFSVPRSLVLQRVLVVEADKSALDTRAAFLEGFGYTVTTARNLGEIELPPELSVVILSLSFGTKILREIAEFVRRRCPRARILLIGDVQFALEDHLYDDAVHHLSRNEELLKVLAKLSDESNALGSTHA